MTKICSKCKTEKDVSEFKIRTKKNGQTCLDSWCKQCYRDAEQNKRNKNPDQYREEHNIYYADNKEYIRERDREKQKIRARERRAAYPDRDLKNWLSSKYNMTLEEYKNRIRAQGNKCACCGKDFSTLEKRPCVDHDHSCCPGSSSCGKCVRGLLCHLCNVSLGFIETGKQQHLFAYLEGRGEE